MAGDAGNSIVKIWDLGPSGDAEWANLPAARRIPDGVHAGRTARGDADPHVAGPHAVTIWDLQTGATFERSGPGDRPVSGFQSFDVSPDGSSIALGGGNRPRSAWGGAAAVRMWDTSTGEELYQIGHELDVNDVSFSPDGEYLVTGELGRIGEDRRSLRPRDPRPPRSRASLCLRARFSPDGRLVATAAVDESEAEPRDDLGLGAR